MPPGEHQEDDPGQAGGEGGPVEEGEPSGRVLGDGQAADSEDDGVAGEDEVAAVDLLAIDGEPPAAD